MKICIWADGFWCEHDEVGQFAHRSDDFKTVVVPDEVEDIDAWAAQQVGA